MNALDDLDLNKGGFAYRDIIGRDRWESFTVSAVITAVGTPTLTGRYRTTGAGCQFQTSLVPATSIETTAGTSYIVLPIAAKGIGGVATMTNDTANTPVGVCHIDTSTSRCYLPSQMASSDVFHVSGWFEI